ncbi:carbohydrate kinase family protein [Candidatus Pacearchaeota archaeon]|nr:carbohydrate kinase family protein [Candidatus Pacearchaeota archaeon]
MFRKFFDVVTFGSGAVDIFIHGSIPEMNKNLVFPIGSKNIIHEIQYHVGGGGTNSAVAFSRFGYKTGLIGKIGNDFFGSKIMKCIRTERIKFLGEQNGDESGVSIIITAHSHDRVILTHKGCNDDISLSDVSYKKVRTKWLYCSSVMGKSFSTQKKIASFLKKNGAKIAFNPSEYLIKTENLSELLKISDVIILNREEIDLLIKKQRHYENNSYLGLSHLGPKIIVITDGKNKITCYDYTNHKRYTLMPHQKKVIEATGAGDGFGSGFIAGLLAGKSVFNSLKLGLEESESVLGALGAHNNLLKFNLKKHGH